MSEKLTGSMLDKNAGQFVKTLQGEKGVGFQDGWHIHKDWYAKTHDYSFAFDSIESARGNRVEHTEEMKYIRAKNVDGKFSICVKDDCFEATEWALGQLSMKIEIPSSTILREMNRVESPDNMHVDTMVMLFNNYARHINQEKKFRLRTYTDGTLRAFLTEKYAIIDNRWVMEVLQSLLPEGRLSHWRSDEDTLYGNILIPDSMIESTDDDGDYGCMVSIGNCEIGKRRLSQTPSIFRSICMNGCIWGGKMGVTLNKRHSGEIDYSELSKLMAENIAEQLKLNSTIMDAFLTTMKYGFNGVPAECVIAAVCKDKKLNTTESAEILSQFNDFEKHHQTLFGVINAITRAGQEFNASRWVELDSIGGDLMNSTKSWDKYLTIARTYKGEDLKEVFGSAV